MSLGHLCLLLPGIELHVDIECNEPLTTDELAMEVASMVHTAIIHAYQETIRADLGSTSIQ